MIKPQYQGILALLDHWLTQISYLGELTMHLSTLYTLHLYTPTICFHTVHQMLLDCAHFLTSMHDPIWDARHWDEFQSPDSIPQMHTFNSLQTHYNTQ